MAAKVKALQQWCKRQCEGYRDVTVTNMTSSWKSGLAFCAIIHRYRPDLIDYDSLKKEDVFDNNKLAFDVAQNELNIPALLDPEDMVEMTVPDKLCIVTYVSQYHNYFRKFEPAGGPGVTATRTPSKRPLPSLTRSEVTDSKKAKEQKEASLNQQTMKQISPSDLQNGNAEPPKKYGTLGDRCCVCSQKVYIMERHMEGSKLYHRKCLRDLQRSSWSPTQKNFRETPPWNLEKRPLDQVDAPKAQEGKSHDLVKTLCGAPSVYKGFNASAKAVTPMEVERPPPRPGHLPVGSSMDNNARKTRRDMPPRSMDSKSVKQKPDDSKVLSGLMMNLEKVRQHNAVSSVEKDSQPKAMLKPVEVPAKSAREPAKHVWEPVKPVREPFKPVTEPGKPFKDPVKPFKEPVKTGWEPVKPVMGRVKEPVETFPVARNRSTSPPKSILKHFDPVTSPSESAPCPELGRSSSPPKSILKHTEFSPDTKQEDAPRRSILKRGSFDSESDEWDESLSTSPHRKKSILKGRGTDSGGSDPDSGPNSRVTSPSRSILKNSTEWLASPEPDDSPRRILKQSPLDHKESPRSILKKSLETPDASPVRSHVRLLPLITTPKDDKPKGILKTRSDDEGEKSVKTTWSPALLKAKKSPGAPSVSTSFAQNGNNEKPAWQVEAERRQKARGGKYVDPEKKHLLTSEDAKTADPMRAKSPVASAEVSRVKPEASVRPKKKQAPPPPAPVDIKKEHKTPQRNGHPLDKEMVVPPVNVPCYLGMNMNDILQKQMSLKKSRPPSTVQQYPIPSGPVDPVHSYHVPSPPPSPPPSLPPRKARIIRSPAFRIADEDAEQQQQDQNNNPPSPSAKRRILPDTDFSFSASRDFGLLDKLDGVSRTSPVPPGLPSFPPPPPPTHQWDSGDDHMNIPKRRVNAEARMATLQIVQTLEGLDDQLRGLEEYGRDLEEKIRGGTDEAMDEDELMAQWFELVNQKNELVRKESELMYRQRQQELEDLHEELEYDLRCLMDKPEDQKTSSDKIREDALLKELLDTVSQRNNIVDSMEEDRIRYMEEDQEIAEMLAQTSSSQKKKKKKNKKKEKKQKVKTPELSSSPDFEIDEIDCEKEREKDKKKGKFFGFSAS
ncbi:hypothetical protein CAPTEDRAFT_229206 [Capitella teleta]|uniref:Calponin-homology (CH) domain-containing protein n=1 Tax=Capitella teleta TaxID=283909 RepID=R7U7V8_CAPTE|nr:hypothetical protein CAPTEDRAFT_229206 [Capitella teleta]|eukprot:ELU02059.1 hypothetical protein CAPTEDRAFT_229206 [Capitella teleta]